MLVSTRRIILPLGIVFLLNLVDWAMTQDALSLGLAREGNPLAAALFNNSPLVALLFKILVVGTCCGLLFILRKRDFAYRATWLTAGLFMGLIFYQVVGRIFLLV